MLLLILIRLHFHVQAFRWERDKRPRYRNEDARPRTECPHSLQNWLHCACVCVPPFHHSPNPRSLLLSALLISQQWALFLQMAPQSAVYLAWPNLWVYANEQPGWGPAASVRILTTMCCFGGTRRGVFGGGGRGGVIVAVSVVEGGGRADGVSACQPDRASLRPAGTAGGLHSPLRARLVRGRPLR